MNFNRRNDRMSNGANEAVGLLSKAKTPLIALAAVGVLAWCFLIRVPTGYVGVVTTPTGLDPMPWKAGLHIWNPLSAMEKVSTKLVPHTEVAHAASHDLQDLTTNVTVPWSITESLAVKFRVEFSDAEEFKQAILIPGIQETIKAVTAKYSALAVLQKREEVREHFETALKNYVDAALKQRDIVGAVAIGRVTVDNVGFTPLFQAAIEARVRAEQAKEKAVQDGSRMVTEAQGEAKEIKAKADAESYEIRELAKAEAAAITREAKALADNPDLVAITAIRNWDGVLPEYMGVRATPLLPLAGTNPEPKR